VSAQAIDTSVAIPLLVKSHAAHKAVVKWWSGRALALCGHALPETYSVLTRLPGDARLDPTDAARLIAARFDAPYVLAQTVAAELPGRLAELGIAGGAVYDAMIGLAAVSNDVELATRDGRARPTYEAVGARVTVAH
jgi:toxin FitB